ncbi:MAG: hypothetical protein HY908_24615 [Myxococcales bacterium]|nr:hypothetical protein [Myxococcales bacterium]
MTGARARRVAGLGARAIVALAATAPRAALAAPPDGGYDLVPPYVVDVTQGPLLAPVRVTGLGGAYAGLAEGIAGLVTNAATPAVRSPSAVRFVDVDLDASLSKPVALFGHNDFANSGSVDTDYSDFLYLEAGAILQVGSFGIGFFGDLLRYGLDVGGRTTDVTLGRYHLLVAWTLLEGQLTLGGGARATTLGIGATDTALTMLGAAPEVGILVRPNWAPFRIGATYRNGVATSASVGPGAAVDEHGTARAGGLVLPQRFVLPWEVEIGAALQVGPRPLNPSWIDPGADERALEARYATRRAARRAALERQLALVADPSTRDALRRTLLADEAERASADAVDLERDREDLAAERRARADNWPREHLLLLLELLVTGAVPDAVHIERFLGQGAVSAPLAPGATSPCRALASGERATFSPRVGVETEHVPQWLQMRFGSYLEANRFRYEPESCAPGPGRLHFTFGADVRLFSTTFWDLVPPITYKLGAYADLAPRYQSFGLGIGVWH